MALQPLNLPSNSPAGNISSQSLAFTKTVPELMVDAYFREYIWSGFARLKNDLLTRNMERQVASFSLIAWNLERNRRFTLGQRSSGRA